MASVATFWLGAPTSRCIAQKPKGDRSSPFTILTWNYSPSEKPMEQDLRQAVEADTFVPYYQPLVSLNGNRVIGFEALARWDGEGEALFPDQFIPLAEETGL